MLTDKLHPCLSILHPLVPHCADRILDLPKNWWAAVGPKSSMVSFQLSCHTPGSLSSSWFLLYFISLVIEVPWIHHRTSALFNSLHYGWPLTCRFFCCCCCCFFVCLFCLVLVLVLASPFRSFLSVFEISRGHCSFSISYSRHKNLSIWWQWYLMFWSISRDCWTPIITFWDMVQFNHIQEI